MSKDVRRMRRASLDSNLKYPWQEAVRDALTEYHTDQIPDKITAAERAISERRRQSPTDVHELLALRDALFASVSRNDGRYEIKMLYRSRYNFFSTQSNRPGISRVQWWPHHGHRIVSVDGPVLLSR